jgi:hypothetical protein
MFAPPLARDAPVVRANLWTVPIAVLVAVAVVSDASAQAPADSSGVRGLYDGGDPAQRPSQPIGAEAAPPATFESPQSNPSDEAAKTDTSSASAFPPTPIEGGEIIARIDGQAVLASDVLWQANYMMTMSTRPIPPEQQTEVRQYLMRTLAMGLIDTKLLYANFRRTVPPENLPQVEASLAKPFEEVEIPRLLKMLNVKDRPSLEAVMQKNGTTLKDVQRQFTEKTIAGEWLRQKAQKPKPVTHEEMLEHYQQHINEYKFEAQVKWEELMVRFDKFGGDRDAAWSALAKMGNQAWTVIRTNPAARGPAFAEIAKAKSHGFTAQNGGLHDWMSPEALTSKTINNALNNLPLGQMSEGLESDLGFHIVRVLDRKAAGVVPFTEAQAKIKEKLEGEQRTKLLTAELDKLRQSAKVWTIFDGDIGGARLLEALNKDAQRR